MTRFVLVRHGQTHENLAGILQGQAGGPLSEEGHRQARALAERLAQVHFDACYSSDLVRARETAEHLVGAHELTPLYVRALREVFVGSWQGKTLEQVRIEHPEEHAAWERGEDIPRGGGERYEDAAVRCAASLGGIAEAFPKGTVLVVSHGASLRAATARLLGLSYGALGGLHNAALSVFDYALDDSSTHTLHVWNDVGHLTRSENADTLRSLLPHKKVA